MTLQELLQEHQQEIVDEAFEEVGRARLRHYEASGPEITRERLSALFERTLESLRARSTAPVREHAESVAEERFRAGYGLAEVQRAFNVMEEAIWRQVMRTIEPAEVGEALALVSTVLGTGKDRLARVWVARATQAGAPALNLSALMKGTTGTAR